MREDFKRRAAAFCDSKPVNIIPKLSLSAIDLCEGHAYLMFLSEHPIVLWRDAMYIIFRLVRRKGDGYEIGSSAHRVPSLAGVLVGEWPDKEDLENFICQYALFR
jgi:hypothetical protein